MRATSVRRSGQVAPGPMVASDFGASLQRVALDRERPW
ncbi:unnamed protein product [Brassica oleracea var. botrytis]